MAEIALTPPMGWNSWDCFGVSVTEQDVKDNADFMAQHLKHLGWEYVVVDLCWYAPEARKDSYKEPNINQLIDEYGRLIPAPNKFPSAVKGQGFKPLADYVHGLGLKLGIHIMRGIPWQAVDQNTPILGTQARAGDIAAPDDMCLWYKSMPGINMTRPGAQAYYDSIAQLYAQWEVDYIKADDMNSWDGDGLVAPYHTDEIEGLSQAIRHCGRDMVLSLSPGAALICNANHLRRHANLWRISADFWDDWEALKRQFEHCHRWVPYAVSGHWPDADMLPLGKIGIRGEVGEARLTNLTKNEQYTMMTLWCMFRSPLMFGGHLPESDPLSLKLISNPEVLAVNQNSTNNHQCSRTDEAVVWMACQPNSPNLYLALFNLSDDPSSVTFEFALEGLTGAYHFRDLWAGRDLGTHRQTFTADLSEHRAGLYKMTPRP